MKKIHFKWVCLISFGDVEILPKLFLTRQMIHQLSMEMIHFDFKLDSSILIQDDIYCIPLFKFCNIGFSITNISNRKLLLRMIIQPFEDFENGIQNIKLGGKLSWIGTLEKNIEVIFFLLKIYKFFS
jgi:hypothetical protein